MVISHIVAQATQAPNNGASNAEDFQPPTRNPQTAPGSLQPGVGSQNTTSQDVLSNPNAHLSVPPTTPAGARTIAKPSTGLNLAFILIVSAVIIVVAEYWFRRRDRGKVAPSTPATPVAPVDSDTTPVVPEPEQVIEPKAASSESAPIKKQPAKKSKSKRKKK
jgi:hypothetical protein